MRAALHRNSVIWTAVALAVASLAAASSAQAARVQPARPAGLAALALPAASPSATGATDISNLGAGGWKVLSSATATQSGAQISTPGFNTSSWLPVANDDAGGPGTEVEALAQNGLCPGDTALQPVRRASSSPPTCSCATGP
jgi:exo-1,4-beta-D-glucosaminidase